MAGNLVQVVGADGSAQGMYYTMGGVRMFISQEQVPMFMQMMDGGGGGMGGGGGGGNFNLGAAADAGQAVYDLISADTLKDLTDRAWDDRRKVRRLRTELAELSPTTEDFKTKILEIFEAQDHLDRSQTEALEQSTRVTLVNAFASGARFVGRLQGYNGGGMGGGGGSNLSTGLLTAIAAGGVITLLWRDDDDGGRRGRRRW